MKHGPHRVNVPILARDRRSWVSFKPSAEVGKGTGKRAPELLRQARQLLTYARRAVPVWIMPLNRVYESFDPRETKFDVVIIDEASQSDVTALSALYFGLEHVVVGDKEQVTTDARAYFDGPAGDTEQSPLRRPDFDLRSGRDSLWRCRRTARALSLRAGDYPVQQPSLLQPDDPAFARTALRDGAASARCT